MENRVTIKVLDTGWMAALLIGAAAAFVLAGCGDGGVSGPDPVDIQLQECDAAPTSVDPITGQLFYDCVSPWRAAPNQPIFTGPTDCETAKGIEQANRPETVQSQPDPSSIRTIMLRCQIIS